MQPPATRRSRCKTCKVLKTVFGLVVDDVCADDEVTTRLPALDVFGLAQPERDCSRLTRKRNNRTKDSSFLLIIADYTLVQLREKSLFVHVHVQPHTRCCILLQTQGRSDRSHGYLRVGACLASAFFCDVFNIASFFTDDLKVSPADVPEMGVDCCGDN